MRKLQVLMVITVLAGSLLLLAISGSALAQDGFTSTAVTLEGGVAGVLVEPEGDGPSATVLMLHGFASHKDEVGNMYLRLAEEMAADYGIGSLRIDFRGWGESEGGMENSTVDGMVEDAAIAYNYLLGLESVDPDRIAVLGFSLGGTVAIVSAGQHPDWYASMGLWSTYGDIAPESIVSPEAMQTAMDEGVVTADLGWREVTLGADFFTSFTLFQTQDEFVKYDGPVFFVAGTEDAPAADYLEWGIANAGTGLRSAYLVEGGDHIYAVLTEDQAMANDVIAWTAAWFDMVLN